MNEKEKTPPFIFYLTLDESLPKTFHTYDRHFRRIGYVLVPVRLDQLQMLMSTSSQEHMIVLCSISDAREYKLYNERIRPYLKYILKSKRITFLQASSFSKLNDQKSLALFKNYFFLKYPMNALELVQKVAQYYATKKEQKTVWPGGRRATLESGAA